MFLIGGMTLCCLGIIGEYVGRIYRELKRRPLYIVDETLGFQPALREPANGDVSALTPEFVGRPDGGP
jgi:dolichol-phosphate mannosyltransferase